MQSTTALSDLTGMSRDLVAKKVRGLPYEVGARNARMYNSVHALPLLYDVPTDTVDLNQARAKLAEKQVEKIDFDMELKSGSFIPYDIMLANAQRVFTAFRTRMCSIATKIAPKLSEESDPLDIEEIVESYVNEALEELNDLEQFIRSYAGPITAVRGGEEPKATGKVNSKPVGRSASKTKR